MEDMRCERARMLLALLSCKSWSSTSGSARAKLFSMLLGRPGTLTPLPLANCSLPAVTHLAAENSLWQCHAACITLPSHEAQPSTSLIAPVHGFTGELSLPASAQLSNITHACHISHLYNPYKLGRCSCHL